MPQFRAAAVTLPCVLLVAGCGAGKKETTSKRSVRPADLASMVVPKRELGTLARGLDVAADGTGRSHNRKAAEDSLDPRDTARGLARAGRVQGYDLTFSAQRRESPLGVMVVSQGVELFRTEKKASAYLNKLMSDFKRFRGRKFEGVKIVRAREFDADVGDEAMGLTLRIAYPARQRTVFGTIVGFRSGRVVGGAMVLLRRELLISGDVERIAEAVDGRIEDVVSGKTRRPVSPKWLDPKALTLERGDLPVRTSLHEQGYFAGPGLRAYLREFDVRGGRLAGSKIFYVRTMATVFKNARLAARDNTYLATPKGSRSVARRFLRAFFRKADFSPRNVTASPLPWRGDTAGFHFFFAAPNGRIEGVLLSVRRGRVTGSVLVMGFERELEPSAVLAMRGKLRARLRGA